MKATPRRLLSCLVLVMSGHAAAECGALYEMTAQAAATTPLDALVGRRLDAASIPPAPLCSDSVFVRRAFIDVIGTLPTAEEAKQFVAERSPEKRRELIDRLLDRPEYADFWALKWGDLLRIKAEFPINLWPNAAQAYHRWVRTALRDNLPYDEFARALLTSSGSNFRVGPVNFYRSTQNRDPAAIARAVALTFMGSRAEKWEPYQLDAMAMCFRYIGYKTTGEWKEEIVFFDPAKMPAHGRAAAIFPDRTFVHLSTERDPREVFADWLIRPDNPWFARAMANRCWAWLLGRGIVHEADDLRPDNPPSNPELLAYLEREFVNARYDVKHLFRVILNSQTYQRSSLAAATAPEGETLFAHYPVRRLDAEVLIDALNQITGTTEKYTSAIPEPFTVLPDAQRAIALPDGSISSAFLESFGRPPRDTGLEAERNNRVTATQRLLLLNSSHIRRKLEQGPRLQAILRDRGPMAAKLDRLYLTILSRAPSDEERRCVEAHARENRLGETEALTDTVWALVNSAEFLLRH